MRDQFFLRPPPRSLTRVSFQAQLQTSWLNMFRRLSYELFHSASITNSIYQLSVAVSLVTMPPERTIESFFTASTKRTCQHIENETTADEGEVWEGGGGADKNGMSNFILSPPTPTTFYFTPPPLRCTTTSCTNISFQCTGSFFFLVHKHISQCVNMR